MFFYLQNKASKLGKGVSLLWNGISAKLLVNAIFRSDNNQQLPDNVYLFESARSAIAFSLKAFGISDGDRVVVCAFTCDAVTYAVNQIGATIDYVDINDDLTMNQLNVSEAIRNGAKVVIVQNTFGKLGLPANFIKFLSSNGVFVLIDNCLSCGSAVDGILLSDYGDLAIESFEVSKTITLGWGGRIKVNNPFIKKLIDEKYSHVKPLSIFSDFQRIFQLLTSVLIRKLDSNVGIFFWYLFYGVRVFRKSCQKKYVITQTLRRMGVLTSYLYKHISGEEQYIYEKSNKNYLLLSSYALEKGLNLVCIQGSREFIVTPRISVLVENEDIKNIKIIANKMGIDIGEWFRECPPQYKIQESNVIQSHLSQKYSSQIINFPCHWGLRQREILKIINLFDQIGAYVKNK